MTRTTRAAATVLRPGTVSGVVLRAARLSANVTKNALAAAAGVSRSTVRSWENGSTPLAFVPTPELRKLEAALLGSGADRQIVADISHAMWCDLVFAAVREDEDINSLLADPISAEEAFRELLAWAMTGQIPARYRRYFPPEPLITNRLIVESAFDAITTAHPVLASDLDPLQPVAAEPRERDVQHGARARRHDRSTARPRKPCRHINRQHHCTPRPWRRSCG